MDVSSLSYRLLQIKMKKNQKITRTCLACGLEKSLAAFLQITGTQGTVYGNICSTCRSTSAREKLTKPEIDEGTRGSSGLKIDSNTRLRMEQIQQEKEQKKHDDKLEHFEKKDQQASEKLTKTEAHDKAQRDHRKDIERKHKTGFLYHTEKKKAQQTPSTVLDSEKASIAENQRGADAQNLENARSEEAKLTTVDTSTLFLDSQFGELKFQSEIFKGFKEWLGSSANFRTLERLYKQKVNQNKQNPEKADPLIEKIENSPKRNRTTK